jgi:lysozyme family protein
MRTHSAGSNELHESTEDGSHRQGIGAIGGALGMGVVAGLRASTATAVLSRAHRRGTVSLASTGISRLFTTGWLARLAPFGVIAEAIVDKMPWVPSRLEPSGLSGRLAVGAACGALVEDVVAIAAGLAVIRCPRLGLAFFLSATCASAALFVALGGRASEEKA